WSKAGTMVSAAGLSPPSQAARLRLSTGKVTVSDGPFAEAKEVIGGFFILDVEDKATAVEMTRRFVELHQRILGDAFQIECEVRGPVTIDVYGSCKACEPVFVRTDQPGLFGDGSPCAQRARPAQSCAGRVSNWLGAS